MVKLTAIPFLLALLIGCAGGGDGDGSADGTDDLGDLDVPEGEYCAAVAGWDEEAAALEEEVLVLVNEARETARSCGNKAFGKAGPLVMEPHLRCAARLHSVDMIERDFFDHVDPDGGQPWDRAEAAGYEWQLVGENIAQGYETAESVMAGWLKSPGHCSNIMEPGFTDFGVGYEYGGSSQGIELHTWTQVFGTPL
jgi:uncharacterized protein YkwD